jgi:hypothetical protein
MARGMKWWVGLTVLVCATTALAYLPPRSAPLRHGWFSALQPPTPFRVREQALASRWRATTAQLQLLEYRDRLRPELEGRRAIDLPGPGILFVGHDALPPAARWQISAQLDTIWARLGIGVPKVSLGIVIESGKTTVTADQPSRKPVTAYLLPDSSDRTSCIVLMPLATTGTVGRNLIQGLTAPPSTLRPMLQNALGPCAFYAAFGAPGRAVARWLGARNFDLALNPRWDGAAAEPYAWVTADLDPRMDPMLWRSVYGYPPDGVGCLGGRPAACRRAVLSGADGATIPHLVTTEYWWREQVLPGGYHYLSDMVRDIGRDRFREFWSSELPVDTALAAALRRPIGQWTQRWQATLVPVLPLGPAAGLGDSLLALGCAAAAFGLVAATLARREVR